MEAVKKYAISLLLPLGISLSCTTAPQQIDAQAPPASSSQVIEYCESRPAPEVTNDSIQAVSSRLTNVQNEARKAAVKVFNPTIGARGTGTYMKYKGHTFILTSAHVVDGPINAMMVRTPAGEEVSAFVVYKVLNERSDFAVLALEAPLETRTAMKLKIAEGSEDLIGQTVAYSGFPGSHRLMSMFGTIAGIEFNGNYVLHSYAWPGASGSAIFDSKGKLVGVLRAIDLDYVGDYQVPQLIEDIVWVSPAHSIDLEKIDTIMKIITLINTLEE